MVGSLPLKCIAVVAVADNIVAGVAACSIVAVVERKYSAIARRVGVAFVVLLDGAVPAPAEASNFAEKDLW